MFFICSPYGGVENSRVWREISGPGAELQRLSPLLETKIKADVAIVFDWESWWALEIDSKPPMDVRQMEQLARHYAPLYLGNIAADFIRPGDDLRGYKLVIVPNLYQVRGADAENLSRYVEQGGTLLMSFFSGITDENEHIWTGGYPTPFRKMLGLVVEEFVPGAENTVRFDTGEEFATDLWADVVHLEGAQALAAFSGNFFAGAPAVTRHRYGERNAFYIGTRFTAEAMSTLVKRVIDEAGIQPALAVPAGVEIIQKVSKDEKYLCILNHLPEAVTVEVAGTDLLTGGPVNPVIEPLGARFVEM